MDNLTKEQRRKNMQNIRSKGTSPEKTVMRELRKRNIYFAKHVDSIIGKPDIVFRKKKMVVFIDSDFWHGHPSRYIKPKSNVKYWKQKVQRNKQRDKYVSCILRNSGWKVIRLWEKDIQNNLFASLKKIICALIFPRKSGHKEELVLA